MRTPRFSIGILVTLALAGGVGRAPPSEQDAAIERAIAEVQRVGGTFGYDESRPGTGITNVEFWHSRVTDSVLSHLKALTDLEDLRLSNAPITDAGIAG